MAKQKTRQADPTHLRVFGFLRKHSLTLVLLLLLVSQLAAYWFQGYSVWVSEQQAHGQPAVIWPDYATHYMSEVWVSILADTYGALIIVFLTKYFYERRSAESKK